jgi:hypothetical protein
VMKHRKKFERRAASRASRLARVDLHRRHCPRHDQPSPSRRTSQLAARPTKSA